MQRDRLKGLYVLTDTSRFEREELVKAVAASIEGGARIVQYRDKSDDVARRREEAAALAELCRIHQRLF
ncbi:MAG: thiamine phosphate synthase, partial [Guyparkeria sp.]